MNIWLIAGIVGLLVLGSIAIVNALSADDEVETETIECSTCANSCSVERNCGRASCGAVSGGSCNCGR